MRRVMATLLVLGVAGMIGYAVVNAGPQIPETGVLVLKLGGSLREAPAQDTFEQLLDGGLALPTVLLQLEKASADPRIAAILLRIRALDVGYAGIQELRDGIARARAAGKRVIAVLDLASLNATRELYLASSATKIYLVPGYVGLFAGIAGQYLHFGGFLEKLGIVMDYERVGTYKSAPEMFSAREMSDEARMIANDLLDGLFAQIVSGIASGRGLEPARVRELVEQAPSTAEEYMAAGLADGVADTLEALELEDLAEAEEISWDTYLQVDPRTLGLRTGERIALIFGDGPILQTRLSRNPGSRTFSADRISQALEDAAEQEDIRAIVLRINSQGGSALASDQLWRQVRRAQEQKPVVVTMGNAAASGGYYVASGSNAIIAQPATFTGSIGVFMMRPSLAGVYQKLEIHSEVLSRGRHAAIVAGNERLTPEQRERASHIVGTLYQDFLERVSEGRGTSTEEIDRLGQGRVWLGEAAYAHGLVDELGGLWAAVHRAQREAGLDPDLDPQRVIFPGPRTLVDQLRGLVGSHLGGGGLRSLLARALPSSVHSLATLAAGELAYLPPYWLEIH